LAGTAEAGSVIQIYDGATLLGEATAGANGHWNFGTAKLVDGVHAFSAKAVDAAGNVSAVSALQNVTVDTTAPSTPTISLSQNASAGNVLNVTGSAEANSTVKIYDGATLLGSTTADAHGNWSYSTPALAVGGHNLSATSTDVAGNIGAP